jgi:hypothetical protein
MAAMGLRISREAPASLAIKKERFMSGKTLNLTGVSPLILFHLQSAAAGIVIYTGRKIGRLQRRCKGIALFTCLVGFSFNAWSAENYLYGHISNVTFSNDEIWIMLDTGVPTNCVGTPYNWMSIVAQDKAMQGFVLGLWMRGDESQVAMTVYTTGKSASGMCLIASIDPDG